MRKDLKKITTLCLISALILAGSEQAVFASGYGKGLAGYSAKVQEQLEKKESSGVRLVKATEYDTTAIAQVTDYQYVNVRDAAGLEGKVVGKLYNNAGATILGECNGWYLIESGDVTGYVKAEYFVTGDAAQRISKQVGNEVATVSADGLMVREAASTEAKILTMVANADCLQVLGEEDGWVRVAVDSDLVGYVSSDYIDTSMIFNTAISIERANALDTQRIAAEKASTKATEDAYTAAENGDVTTCEDAVQTAEYQLAVAQYIAYLNTEDAFAAMTVQAIKDDVASCKYSLYLAKLRSGQITPSDTTAAETVQNTTDSGETATTSAETTETTAPETKESETEKVKVEEIAQNDNGTTTDIRQQVTSFACQFVGNPYVWGGTSLTNGADCSGFVQSVYKHFGISLPRVAADQANAGRAVDLADIKPGDLLFYKGSGGTVGHVTMYIGDGKVVHASSSTTGIIISSVNYRTPCWARRFLD